MFINDVEVIHFIFLGPKFLQYTDVLAGTPCCIDRNIECGGFVEEKWEFGKDGIRMFFDRGFEVFMGIGTSESSTHSLRYKGTVLNDVFESSTVRSRCL